MTMDTVSGWLREESFIDTIADKIAYHVIRDGEDLQGIFTRLQSLEWNVILSTERARVMDENERRAQEHLEWLELERPCARCGQKTKNKDLKLFSAHAISPDIPLFSTIPYGYCCSGCYLAAEKDVIDSYERECLVCGVVFFAKRNDIRNPLCKKHNTEEIRREMLRVNTQNARARSFGLDDDLTLNEWMEIIKKHKNKCHYCGDKWTDLEHVKPVSKGGGTTRLNVVPSCRSCNIKKGNEFLVTSTQGVMAL